jgi:transcriptional regulator with XRE-family HTH domain
MKTKRKLESAFGVIEKSKWLVLAEKWKQELPWKVYSQQIALEILEHLDEHGLSQKEFAQRMEVSPQMASKWLKGETNFTLETISKLETILGISLFKITNQNVSGQMLIARFDPIHVVYEKPRSNKEENAEKLSKIIKLHDEYTPISIAN